MKITTVILGEPITVNTSRWARIGTVLEAAVKKSRNDPTREWQVFDQKGNRLDPRYQVKDYRITRHTPLTISPPAGHAA